jgi:hypothetical protein
MPWRMYYGLANLAFYSPYLPLSIGRQNSRKGPRTTAIVSLMWEQWGLSVSSPPNNTGTGFHLRHRQRPLRIEALESDRGCKCRKTPLGFLCTSNTTHRPLERGMATTAWEPGVARLGGCIALPAAVISNLGLLRPHPIGCCRCHDNCLAKLPKPGCGTSNKPLWRLIRPQGCHAENPIPIVCCYHVGMSIGLLTLGGDIPDPGRQLRH